MSSEESGMGTGKYISYLQPLPGFFTSFKNDRQAGFFTLPRTFLFLYSRPHFTFVRE